LTKSPKINKEHAPKNMMISGNNVKNIGMFI